MPLLGGAGRVMPLPEDLAALGAAAGAPVDAEAALAAAGAATAAGGAPAVAAALAISAPTGEDPAAVLAAQANGTDAVAGALVPAAKSLGVPDTGDGLLTKSADMMPDGKTPREAAKLDNSQEPASGEGGGGEGGRGDEVGDAGGGEGGVVDEGGDGDGEDGGGGNGGGGLKGLLQRGMTAERLPPLQMSTGISAPSLQKWNSVLPTIKKEDDPAASRAVRGKILLESSGREQEFLFLPDGLLLGEKRDKLTAAKLFALLELPMPQLLFFVSNGDVTSTWHMRKPAGFDLNIGMPGGAGVAAKAEEQEERKLGHWRNVMKQKLMAVLTNTAKSCNESGAYFMIDASVTALGLDLDCA